MKTTNPILTSLMTLVPANESDEINYANFFYRAEVDWVRLYFRTITPTNHETVTRLMGVPYAKPLDKSAGGAATEFLVTIQAPASWQAIQDKLDVFTATHKLIDGPSIDAIEIAFDAYSKFEDRDDLVNMAGRFLKFHTHIGHNNRRFAGAHKGHTVALGFHQVNLERFATGYSAYAGDQRRVKKRAPSRLSMRIYVKEFDQGKPLPIKAHRARTERTFLMAGLVRPSLTDWKKHDFTAEACYFNFRTLKPLLPACVRYAVDRMPQLGEPHNRKRVHGGGVKKFRRSTVADTVLNRLAYEALRNLTNRMQYVSPIAKARTLRKLRGWK